MSIEELVNRAYTSWAHDKGISWTDHLTAALTEQYETHAIELRAYEATVQNLEQRIDELTGVHLTVGDGLSVYGTGEAIRRAQAYILLDSSHPSEAKGTARHFASALQVAEQRIRELEADNQAAVVELACKIRKINELEAQRVPELQPIETAPKNGEHVLLWEKYSDFPVVGYFSHRLNMWVACTEHYDTIGDAKIIDTLSQVLITHWMPLPAAPKKEE